MVGRLRLAVLGLALALALLGGRGGAAAPAPAHAAKGMELAIQDDPVLVSEIGMKRSRALKLLAQLHVTRIRVNVPWSSVVKSPRKHKRPKHRRYDFATYDALLTAARQRGIRLELTISGFAPAWATANHKIGDYKINVRYFKEFVRVVATHFKGLVDRYAIWNEPNYVSWNGPLKTAARTYRSMYVNAWKTIKKIDPAAQVLIGETAPYAQSRRCIAPLKFIREVVRPGPLKADGYAHHPYDFRHSLNYRYPGKDNVTMSTLSRLTRQLDSLARAGRLETPAGRPLDVYLTEYGYMESGKYKIPESRRAKYMTEAFQRALDNPRVKQMLQYLLVKPPRRGLFFDTSIVSKRGKRSKTFKALASWSKKRAKEKRIALASTPPR